VKMNHTARRMANTTIHKLLIICVIILSSRICVQASDGEQQQLRGKAAEFDVQSTRKTFEDENEPAQKPQIYEGKMTRNGYRSDAETKIKYPWFTLLVSTDEDSGIDSCGGALIAKDLVLTAASCRDPTTAHIGLKNDSDPAKESIEVRSVVRHPNSLDNNVMIVQLTAPVSETAPVRLNFEENYPVLDGESLTMLGFGSTVGFPQILEAEIIHYVPFELCAVAEDPDKGVFYGTNTEETIVKPNWFCTTDPTNVTIVDATDGSGNPVMTSMCFGQSGGPIIKEDYFVDAVTTSSSGEPSTDDLLLAVISETSRYCGNPHLPAGSQRVFSYKQWIIETGCPLSIDPPAEWNCGGDTLIAPTDNSVYYSVSEPTLPQTKLPSKKPTVAPTSEPTPAPTPFPTTEKPNPFPIPNPTNAELPVPPLVETFDDEDDDKYNYVYVCPICDKNEVVTNPDSIVFVPVLGQKTCHELVTAASQGKIEEGGECDSVLLVATAVCSCAERTNVPTGSPTARPSVAPTGSPSAIPTRTPTANPSAKSTRVPTANPSVTPTRRPTAKPSTTPTRSPTARPSATPTRKPTAKPSVAPTRPPTLHPTTLSPTNRPPSPPTCWAIQIAKHDESKLIDVVIDFSFLDSSSARSVGWFVADPGHECFRLGVLQGAYVTRTVQEKLTLVKNVEYIFALDVNAIGSGDGEQPSGSYSITSMGTLLASHDVLENQAMIRFTTPH